MSMWHTSLVPALKVIFLLNLKSSINEENNNEDSFGVVGQDF